MGRDGEQRREWSEAHEQHAGREQLVENVAVRRRHTATQDSHSAHVSGRLSGARVPRRDSCFFPSRFPNLPRIPKFPRSPLPRSTPATCLSRSLSPPRPPHSLRLFQQRKPSETKEWAQKLPDFVLRLEEAVYRGARTKVRAPYALSPMKHRRPLSNSTRRSTKPERRFHRDPCPAGFPPRFTVSARSDRTDRPAAIVGSKLWRSVPRLDRDTVAKRDRARASWRGLVR